MSTVYKKDFVMFRNVKYDDLYQDNTNVSLLFVIRALVQLVLHIKNMR